MRAWYFGNTTVRSPFRLRDALVVLSSSPLQGDLHGEQQEKQFISLLVEKEIVKPGKSKDKTYSVGRKWRVALSQLGFLIPELPIKCGVNQSEIGLVDTITPNGWRLIRSQSVPAMQECFLRSLAAYYIPSPIEKKFSFSMFSPLRHILLIMLELEKRTGDSKLSFIEFALIVQLTNSDDILDKIITDILNFRSQRELAVSKRKFDGEQREIFNKAFDYKGSTLNDYADTNIRYIKATGLVQNKGRGIAFVPEKKFFIESLLINEIVPGSNKSYFLNLIKGAHLPTDDKIPALAVLKDLINTFKIRDIVYDFKGRIIDDSLDIRDITNIRHELEDLLSEKNEDEYAVRQAEEWKEISAYMSLINSQKNSMTLDNGEEIKIPSNERPAYFEWILWRAFLAINNLCNKSRDSRRFKIDQDFLPICTAPGSGPDLVFEFKEFVIVVEVTLMGSSRQEAAEGEPVRRHVADLVIKYESIKPVYGLFIANQIDLNTAETFRIGVWYTKNDAKMSLNIIPVKLEQFKNLFDALFTSNKIDISLIREIFDDCFLLRKEHEAPAWKREIANVFNEKISTIRAANI